MVNPELVKQLLRELEREYERPVQLKVEPLAKKEYSKEFKLEGTYLGGFLEREVNVSPISGESKEYEIAAKFKGTYTLKELGELVEKIFSEEQSPNDGINFDAPMNIKGFEIRTNAIYAITDGTYGPAGHLVAHPGFEDEDRPYRLKVADITL